MAMGDRGRTLGVHQRPGFTPASDKIFAASKEAELVAIAVDDVLAVQSVHGAHACVKPNSNNFDNGPRVKEEAGVSSSAEPCEEATQWQVRLSEVYGMDAEPPAGGTKKPIIGGREKKKKRHPTRERKTDTASRTTLAEAFRRSAAETISRNKPTIVHIDWSRLSSIAADEGEPSVPLLGMVTSHGDLVVFAPPLTGDYRPRVAYVMSADVGIARDLAAGAAQTSVSRHKRKASALAAPSVAARGVCFLDGEEAGGGRGGGAVVTMAVSLCAGDGDRGRVAVCELKRGTESDGGLLRCSLRGVMDCPANSTRSAYHHLPLVRLLRPGGRKLVLAACRRGAIALHSEKEGSPGGWAPLVEVGIPAHLIPTCFWAEASVKELCVRVGFSEGSVGSCALPLPLDAGEQAGFKFSVERVHPGSVSGLGSRASSSHVGGLVAGGRTLAEDGSGSRMGAAMSADGGSVLSVLTKIQDGHPMKSINPHSFSQTKFLWTSVECKPL